MISVIVTVYNKDFYIRKCIESIENNTYKNIELIIVEDCSTDNSLSIIKELMAKYDNIYLIQNTENKGAGFSRNIGIKAANGEWISLIDADEYIEKDYFQVYVNNIENNTDIIYGGFKYYLNNTLVNTVDRENKILVNMEQYICDLYKLKLQYFNMALINAALFENIEYCKERYIEEIPTIYMLLFHSKKIQTISYNGYNINITNNSLTRSHTKLYSELCVYNNIIPSLEYIKKYNYNLWIKVYNLYLNKISKLGYKYAMNYNDFQDAAPFFHNIMKYYHLDKNILQEQKEYVIIHSSNRK